MKIAISYPPLDIGKGVPLLGQNRQFQWFNSPTYIYPMVPAYAATLLKTNGYDVIWNDAIAEEWTQEQYFEFIKNTDIDLIAIETKAPVVKLHWEIVSKIKEINPKVQIVMFGDHLTAYPMETMENSPVDYILTGGDYDFLLLNLCEVLSSETQINKLEPGIYYRNDNEIKSTGDFVLKHDLNTLPMIDRDLTKWKLYSEKNGNYSRTPGTYTYASRDCWYHKCTFCSWTTLYGNFRSISPEKLLDEVGILIEKYGVREIMDDSGAFSIGNWLRTFCNGMIERGYNKKVIMDCNMRFGALSFDDYKLMKQAGFRFILFGLESANQSTLDRINKGVKIENMIESCRLAKKAGLSPHVTIMFGYPWEDEKDVKNTVKLGRLLLKKGYAHTLQATIVIPYPGTPLYNECKENGWLQTEDYAEYDMRRPVMKTPLGDEKLMQAVQSVYKVAFNPEFLFRRIISIRSWSDIKFFARAAKQVWGHLVDFGE
ncbi:MAG: radical SAM protein [Oscillospiraceae bacterium]|jgi:radical SAM superfamily enzyme YgiQ (UPF0313 family)|nr:radical SAM protein [Oscillospiraceae bacterium]